MNSPLDLLHAARDEAVAALRELIRIPSVSGTAAESEAVAWVADLLRREGVEVDHWRLPLAELTARADFPGAEVERTQAWGVVARLPGAGGRSLMLNGHLDVVPPGDREAWHEDPFSGLVDGEHVFGRGACDMKGGVISALFAFLAVHRSGVTPPGDVLFAGVVGEEDGGLGTFATLARGWSADACVITEPTGLDVVPANGGALTFRLRVPGLAAHAADRTSGVSAVEKFHKIFAALRELEAARTADVDPLMRRHPVAYPLEVGSVRAGDWSSTVPDLLVAEGRFGVALDEPVPAARAAFEAAVADACAADPWLAAHPVTVEWWGGQFASGRCPAASDLVPRVLAAHGSPTPAVYGATYGSDLRLLAGAGVPTVQYGPGQVRWAHAPDERVPVAEVLRCAETLVRLALS
ncbi:acetylornithine deacetylase [Virgisporangium aliadipatigenens]|uniref:Probable succinyl-diaminopimelate desuccinylase n=1 Tax=Virgisporangium aliadipatigenens TaxID=741659 RepID=A0A8J4DW93_9ACTN|nr:ArgE/DapE family deacylase [Virgisporangium aliadipatigenens]GIJ50907.1 acetylornithine deacetylase [Virgisporangium aliadipatigenens]